MQNEPQNCFLASAGRPIETLDELRTVGECLLLYSGGVDSRYFLLWAAEHGVRVLALTVELSGEGSAEQDIDAVASAKALGATPVYLERTCEFASRFIAPAIRANASYYGVYPVCSSLSRPFMAELAVEIAAAHHIGVIVHGSTWVQNSAFRFNNSIRSLAPGIVVGNPFASMPIDRDGRKEALRRAGVAVERKGLYSIDANLWGRVIEAGPLDDPATAIPEEVFTWTTPPAHAPRETTEVRVAFTRGVPTALNGSSVPLAEIVQRLNVVGGRYGTGRFNGLEDLHPSIGVVKNHEVREAPAAHALLTAHRQLEQAILTQDELRWKWSADWEWTRLVVNGGWHTPLKAAIEAGIDRLSERINGDILLQFAPGSVIVAAIAAQDAPHYWNLSRREAAATAVASNSY